MKTTETLMATETTEIPREISALSGSQCRQWLNLADFLTTSEICSNTLFRPMTPIPLEDTVADIVGKAMRGLQLNDEQVAARSTNP